MSLSLNTIKPAKGSVKKRKRVGRGNASGHGTYSTRGLKGQRSRSGGKNKLKRLGFKKNLLALPKSRGFHSSKPKNQIVDLTALSDNFKDGAEINPLYLLKAKLIENLKLPVKILGDGELKKKNLVFSGIKVSESAREKIIKLGGKVN